MSDDAHTLLIWDGECGFCRNAVTWLLRQDHDASFRAVPFQELPSPPMTPALRRQAERAVQVLTPQGQQISGGRAVLYVLEQVGWHPWLVRIAGRWPIVWLVEVGYWVVARNRQFFSRLMFQGSGCQGCGGNNAQG